MKMQTSRREISISTVINITIYITNICILISNKSTISSFNLVIFILATSIILFYKKNINRCGIIDAIYDIRYYISFLLIISVVYIFSYSIIYIAIYRSNYNHKLLLNIVFIFTVLKVLYDKYIEYLYLHRFHKYLNMINKIYTTILRENQIYIHNNINLDVTIRDGYIVIADSFKYKKELTDIILNSWKGYK